MSPSFTGRSGHLTADQHATDCGLASCASVCAFFRLWDALLGSWRLVIAFPQASRGTASGQRISRGLMLLVITTRRYEMPVFVRLWLPLLPRGVTEEALKHTNPWDLPQRFWFNGSQGSTAWASVFKGSLGYSNLQPRLRGMGGIGLRLCIVGTEM